MPPTCTRCLITKSDADFTKSTEICDVCISVEESKHPEVRLLDQRQKASEEETTRTLQILTTAIEEIRESLLRIDTQLKSVATSETIGKLQTKVDELTTYNQKLKDVVDDEQSKRRWISRHIEKIREPLPKDVVVEAYNRPPLSHSDIQARIARNVEQIRALRN